MTTKYFEHQSGKIAYDDVGSGPLVICAPSMGDLRQEYRFLARQLADAGYRAVSMDVRGHGETSTGWADYSVAGVGADLVALIQHLNAGPAAIIGESMAAGAAIWAAAEAPECVTGLVLIGPFTRGEGMPLVQLLFRIMFSRPWGPSMWLRYYKSLYPSRKPADFDAYCAELYANLKQPGRLEALQKMIDASKRASEERIPRMKSPALVLMGSKDPDFKPPEAEAKWVADALHGTYHMIEGAGHYPQTEMPEVTAPLILSFLQSLREGK
ncbi:MAG: alpha/beta hydrolase [Anaerolineae bacterium]